MVATIVSYSVTQSTGSSITIARPDDVEEGDLLILLLTIGQVAAEAATITFPSVDWRDHAVASPVTGTGVRTMQAFKYLLDVEEPTYVFTYTASRPMIGTLIAIRGAKRDFTYNSVLYPYGYFAPGNPTLGSATVAATTTISPAALLTTATFSTLAFYLFTQYDSTSGSPRLDDPSPLVDIIHRSQGALLAALCMTVMYDEVQTASAITVVSSKSKPWVAVSIAVESNAPADSLDNYKSKLLRRTLPPPYDTRFSSTLGKVLTVIGTSDNEIGGLFGEDDFLPDEV